MIEFVRKIKIQRAKENIGYYKEMANALESVMETSPYFSIFNEEDYIRAKANLGKYEQRLKSLIEDQDEKD